MSGANALQRRGVSAAKQGRCASVEGAPHRVITPLAVFDQGFMGSIQDNSKKHGDNDDDNGRVTHTGRSVLLKQRGLKDPEISLQRHLVEDRGKMS